MRRLVPVLAILALPAIALAQPPGRPRVLQQPAMPAPVRVAPVSSAAQPILIQHGRIYTVGPQGTFGNGDVLIADGKIMQV